MTINYFIAVLALLFSLYVLGIVFKQNKRIVIKGRATNYLHLILMFICLLMFPLREDSLIDEVVRNTLVLVAFFSIFFIKKGLTENGVVFFMKEKKFESKEWVFDDYSGGLFKLSLAGKNFNSTLLIKVNELRNTINHFHFAKQSVLISPVLKKKYKL